MASHWHGEGNGSHQKKEVRVRGRNERRMSKMVGGNFEKGDKEGTGNGNGEKGERKERGRMAVWVN